MQVPKVDLLLCFPEKIFSRFVQDTLLPLVLDPAIHRVMCKVGLRSEYGREILLNQFLKGDSEWVFLVDTDMVLPPRVLPRLMQHGKRMITGLYFGRGEKCHPIIFLPEPVDQYPKTRYFNYPQNSLIEVGICGHGCLLIHRSVLEAMEPPYSQLGPFEDQPFLGSDLRLCLKARKEAGVKVWCDTSIKCGHLHVDAIEEQDYLDRREEYIEEFRQYRLDKYGTELEL